MGSVMQILLVQPSVTDPQQTSGKWHCQALATNPHTGGLCSDAAVHEKSKLDIFFLKKQVQDQYKSLEALLKQKASSFMFLVSESQAGNDMSDAINLCLMLKMTIHECSLCNEFDCII